MSEMNKLNVDELSGVVGGVIRKIQNDAGNYANIRRTPGLDGKIFAKAYNGTKVNTTSKTVRKDGYDWYEVIMEDSDIGWIAGNLIGY